MPTPQTCTEEEISRLVHHFYASARADATLGPIFDEHVSDWDGNLAKMVDFWSSAPRGTARYPATRALFFSPLRGERPMMMNTMDCMGEMGSMMGWMMGGMVLVWLLLVVGLVLGITALIKYLRPR